MIDEKILKMKGSEQCISCLYHDISIHLDPCNNCLLNNLSISNPKKSYWKASSVMEKYQSKIEKTKGFKQIGQLIRIKHATIGLLEAIGEDLDRPGLVETPIRVAKAWMEMTSGYEKDPKDILKCFEDGAENYDSMILVKDLPVYSFCEHHVIPWFGTVTIGYIPNGKILGLSKFSRLVDIYAKRLQVQERLTSQVAEAIFENLNPIGVGVVVKARHLCMEMRGIRQQGHHTVTQCLKGAMMDDAMVRNEFLSLAR